MPNNWNPLKNRIALPNGSYGTRKASKAAKITGNTIPLASPLNKPNQMAALPFSFSFEGNKNTIIPGFTKTATMNELRSSRRSRRKTRRSRKTRRN